MFSFPDFVGEGVFVGVYYGFYAIVHDSEGLKGPEVASGISELFVFKQKSISKLAVEHEIGLGLSVSANIKNMLEVENIQS